jgi:hypothetical protein
MLPWRWLGGAWAVPPARLLTDRGSPLLECHRGLAGGRSGFRLTTPSAEIIGARGERNRYSRVHLIGRETARGRFLVGEPVAMRRPGHIPLDRMKFPLTLAGGLRTAFADFVLTPLPRHLADLMRQLHEDRDNPLQGGREPGHGASTAETSRRIDRRGRR